MDYETSGEATEPLSQHEADTDETYHGMKYVPNVQSQTIGVSGIVLPLPARVQKSVLWVLANCYRDGNLIGDPDDWRPIWPILPLPYHWGSGQSLTGGFCVWIGGIETRVSDVVSNELVARTRYAQVYSRPALPLLFYTFSANAPAYHQETLIYQAGAFPMGDIARLIDLIHDIERDIT